MQTQKSEIRNPKSEIRNPKSSQRYLKVLIEKEIGKQCLAQRRKGRQGSEFKYGSFFACVVSLPQAQDMLGAITSFVTSVGA
jgi:hypothetical protein